MLHAFGEIVRQARQDRHIKLYDMAQALGISSADLSGYEVGRKTAPPEVVAAVAEYLGFNACAAGVLALAAQEPLIERAAPQGPVFVSYQHQEGVSECPCNSCRFERSEP